MFTDIFIWKREPDSEDKRQNQNYSRWNEIHGTNGEMHSDGPQKKRRDTTRTKNRSYTGQHFEI
jgi:hypothetical protein